MLRVPRSRLAASILTATLALGGVTAAALMPTPAYADAISNAYNLNGYKLASDLDTVSQGLYNEPASYQPARWTGTAWQSQAAYVNDSKAAYLRSLSGYQATDAVASTTHAQQMATQTVNGKTQAGAATLLKTAERDAAASKFKLPAFKATPFVKGLGTATIAVTGFQAGWNVGKFGMDMFGYDYEGMICDTGNKGLVDVYKVDCPNAVDFQTSFEPNADAEGGFDYGKSCLDDGFCLTWGPRVVAGTEYPEFFQGRTAQEWAGNGKRSIDQQKGNWQVRVKWSNGFTQFENAYTPEALAQDSSMVGVQYQKLCSELGTFQSCFPSNSTMGNVLAWGIQDSRTGAGPGFHDVTQNQGDPQRTLQCAVTGDDGNVYTQETPSFKESDGKLPSPQCPALPDGVHPSHVDVAEKNQDTGATTKLQSQDATDAYKNAVAQYPECGSGLCTLDLVQTSSSKSCFDLDETCNGWFQDADKGTKYACYYGSHTVELRQCNVYAQVFDPAKRAAGNPYALPDGSDPEMQSTLTDGQKAFSDPVQDPSDVRSCIAANVSMNPITWVQFPVQCAMQWAFVPREVKLRESTAKIKLAWDDTAPVTLANTVGAWDFKPVMTGCDGIVYPDNLVYKGMPGGHLGNACPGTALAPAAKFTSIVLTILASVGAALAVASYMGWTIGYRGPAEG